MANEGHLYIITADRRIQKAPQCVVEVERKTLVYLRQPAHLRFGEEVFFFLSHSVFLLLLLRLLLLPRNKQINSNQISALAVTFKQFNLHPYVKRRAAL